jgi:hypothetical protein
MENSPMLHTFSAASNSQLVNTKKAAVIVDLSPTTLQQMRWRGDKRIPWVKMGRSVRYKVSDLQAFIESSIID